MEGISREEHEEFKLRFEEKNKRQDKRIELLEENVRQIGALTTSVERLAVNMENMLRIQEQQTDRLEMLESRDGEKWRQVTMYCLTTVLGIVIGFVCTHLGI